MLIKKIYMYLSVMSLLLAPQTFLYAQKPGDVDCNGKIDILDGLKVAQYYVGVISDFGPCGCPVEIPDEHFDNCIREELGIIGRAITSRDVQDILTFWGYEFEIEDLTGAEYFVSLEKALFYMNRISDLKPLSRLISLKLLMLDINNITDVTPLAGLINLHNLSLDENEITDIKPLAGLTSLQTLSLANNRITDISVLSRLSALENLSLQGNPLDDNSIALIDELRARGVNVSY